MKKLFALFLSTLLIISFCACDKSPDETPIPDDAPPASTETAVPSPTPDKPQPTEIPDLKPDDAPEIPDDAADKSPEPDDIPDTADELTVYINNSPVTVPAAEYTAELKKDALSFSLLYDADGFKADFKNNAYLITPTSENASPFDYMEICFINGGTADAILPSFADSYIDFSDIEFASYTPIGELGTNAESVIAYNAEQYINAYLIDVSGGVVTIVLSSTSNSSEVFIWLSAFLSTFSMH